jgi:hypothetical protein
MNIQSEIENHERSIEILIAIQYFKDKKIKLIQDAFLFSVSFPDLKLKTEHKADICRRVILRLTDRYKKHISL